MTCTKPTPIFASPTQQGIAWVSSYGDGQSVLLRWDPAYSPSNSFLLGYNIYYSTKQEAVFTEGPKYFTTETLVRVMNLIPGDMTYFGRKGEKTASR